MTPYKWRVIFKDNRTKEFKSQDINAFNAAEAESYCKAANSFAIQVILVYIPSYFKKLTATTIESVIDDKTTKSLQLTHLKNTPLIEHISINQTPYSHEQEKTS